MSSFGYALKQANLSNRLQNWRAAVALLFSVIPGLPGLIGNINTNIKVGNASHLFDIAWLFGVCKTQ